MILTVLSPEIMFIVRLTIVSVDLEHFSKTLKRLVKVGSANNRSVCHETALFAVFSLQIYKLRLPVKPSVRLGRLRRHPEVCCKSF